MGDGQDAVIALLENWIQSGQLSDEEVNTLTSEDWDLISNYANDPGTALGVAKSLVSKRQAATGQPAEGTPSAQPQAAGAQLAHGTMDAVKEGQTWTDPQTGWLWTRSQGQLYNNQVDYELKDPKTGAQVPHYKGWQMYTPPKVAQPAPPKADRGAFVGLTSIGGYDFPQYKRADGTTYTGDNPVGRTASPDTLTAWQQEQLARADQERAYQQQQDATRTAQAQAGQTMAIQRQLDAEYQNRLDRQTQDQTNATNQWMVAQRQQEAQGGYPNAMQAWLDRYKGISPTDFVALWNMQSAPPPVAPIGPGQSGQRGGFGFAKSPAGAAMQGYTSWMQAQQAQKQLGIDMNRQQVWDPVQHSYRPETDQEYQYRTVTQPANSATTGFQGLGNQAGPQSPGEQRAGEIAIDLQAQLQQGAKDAAASVASWNSLSPDAQAALAAQFAAKRIGMNVAADPQKNLDALRDLVAQSHEPTNWNVGPKTPTYLQGAVQSQWVPTFQGTSGPTNPNVGSYQINVNRLGAPGSAVRPVSATSWQQWTPSQQRGYAGLVARSGVYDAQGRRVTSQDPADWFDNLQNMWQSSRPGQLATQRVKAY